MKMFEKELLKLADSRSHKFHARPPPVHERLSISAWQAIVGTRKYPDPEGFNYFLASPGIWC